VVGLAEEHGQPSGGGQRTTIRFVAIAPVVSGAVTTTLPLPLKISRPDPDPDVFFRFLTSRSALCPLSRFKCYFAFRRVGSAAVSLWA